MVEIGEEISKKRSELELLKTECIELKDFINSKFKEEFLEYDYKVDITNCYIISIGGKKYIARRKHITERTNSYTLIGGTFILETYQYYDVLNVVDKKFKYLGEYRCVHDNHNSFSSRFAGEKPDYEEHLLKFYPELAFFVDNKVPNTYLKKIYYEVNELGSKKLIKGKN